MGEQSGDNRNHEIGWCENIPDSPDQAESVSHSESGVFAHEKIRVEQQHYESGLNGDPHKFRFHGLVLDFWFAG
jgi:hypothetical protein